MKENICLFVPHHKDYHSIHTINFVLERNPKIYTSLTSYSVYRVHYVYSGSGILHTPGMQHEIKKGDIFFTFPSMLFSIEAPEDFSYMYVSFVGARGNMIMEKLGINNKNFIFRDCIETEPLWERGINMCDKISDIASESVLLYTFSHIGNKLIEVEQSKPQNNISLETKKFIDDNFTNPDLSLVLIADALNYNEKYISSTFKKHFGLTVTKYINTIRMQHACTLMKQGFSSISDISSNCGYSDPQYFSKLFKKSFGETPGEYRKGISDTSHKSFSS